MIMHKGREILEELRGEYWAYTGDRDGVCLYTVFKDNKPIASGSFLELQDMALIGDKESDLEAILEAIKEAMEWMMRQIEHCQNIGKPHIQETICVKALSFYKKSIL